MGNRSGIEIRKGRADGGTSTNPRGVVRRMARWWLDGWLSVPRRALVGPESRAMAADAHRLVTELRTDYQRWQRARVGPRRTLSYAQMLVAWGIAEEDVPYTRRALRRARWRIGAVALFTYGALVAQIVLDRFHSWTYLLLAFVCVLSLSISTLVLSWRLHCVCVRKYEEFPAWLGARLPKFRRSVR